MKEERFEFTSDLKKKLGIIAIVGLVITVLGIIIVALSGHGGHEAGHGHEEPFHWSLRLLTDLWINSVYFTGIALLGTFFVAINYAAQAGWSASIKRIPMAFGNWLPISLILMLVLFLIGGHDLFHWTHETTDPIILGKRFYLNEPFFIARLILYFVLWYFLWWVLRKNSLQEDEKGGYDYWRKMRKYSAIFLVIFAITSSTSAWDWVMSTDPHWFSTIFGWYTFIGWFVISLVTVTLMIIFLKENGYLQMVNVNHYHDLGKYIFAFSIFWAYLWVSQYLLIYYSNIPEEALHYHERLHSSTYAPLFYINIILNFFFPFLVLMTRDSKRFPIFLKIAGVVLIIGHWIDMYQLIAPPILGENGAIGLMEVGLFMMFAAAFLFVAFNTLSKASLVAKNHPMLEESLHYHS